VGFLCVSFKHSEPNLQAGKVIATPMHIDSASRYPQAYTIYISAELEASGLSFEAFQYAWKGYQRLQETNQVANSRYLTICDFSQSSRKKRLYIIDIEETKLVTNTYVAHGRNSGGEYATRFSNRHESLQSSLGFYVTGKTYIGAHGLSLRLLGVDGNFNDQALSRTIVIHGATYVDENRVNAGGYMGRSWGCPALPQNESATIINTIKEGTCLFIFHPIKTYLVGSKILNG
jgi:L,D-transpeptidase catalytic domain